jgi:hypothetical protein
MITRKETYIENNTEIDIEGTTRQEAIEYLSKSKDTVKWETKEIPSKTMEIVEDLSICPLAE